MIQVTSAACAEVKRLLEKQGNPGGTGLRLGVKGGGCSGLSYAMSLDTQREGDNVFETEGLKVYVDPKSYLYLNNTVVDFQDGLQGRGFKFSNPNAQKTCGCGESFSV
ncbi:MAG TPA: iron-sulfur cluster assembly accessory protein [Candidatus Omnitrophota bacterium]|nr:iron-sulfur cluster assembly accessory protein [Candidatus Omnitrophota bacterium]